MRTKYIGAARLENGVVIHLRTDGSALGEDGKIYYAVSVDDVNGDCEIIGYSCDIKEPLNNAKAV